MTTLTPFQPQAQAQALLAHPHPNLHPHLPPRPHSSTLSHLTTDLTLLSTLHTRSSSQHRSQLFLRSIGEVLRLGKLVVVDLTICLGRDFRELESGSESRSGNGAHSKESTMEKNQIPVHMIKSNRRLSLLLDKLLTSLIHATTKSLQMIQLSHFLPLQTLLLSIYARLYTITLGVIDWIRSLPGGNVLDEVTFRKKTNEHQHLSSNVGRGLNRGDGKNGAMEGMDIDPSSELGGLSGRLEIGEKIQRPPMPSSLTQFSEPIKPSTTERSTSHIISPTTLNPLPSDTTLVETDNFRINKNKKRVQHSDQIDKHHDQSLMTTVSPTTTLQSNTKFNNSPLSNSPTRIDSIDKVPNDLLSSKGTVSQDIKPKKKKMKRRDAMDDIFGF